MMDNLSKRATLVSLKVSKWSGRCVDKQISQNVLIQHNAQEEAGSFSKKLLPESALKEISSIINEAKKYYKEKTLAWEDGKFRLLPTKLTSEFMCEMRDAKVKLDHAVNIFKQDYENYKIQAKTMLNGLYKEGDYPQLPDFDKKFNLEFNFQNISDPKDFRCEVSQDIKEIIQKNMKDSMEKQYAESIKRLYERIHTVISHFNEKLSEYSEGSKLYSSMIINIHELVKILPDLNIMNDENIAQITERIQKQICKYDINELRHSPTFREGAIKASSDIMKDLEALYG